MLASEYDVTPFGRATKKPGDPVAFTYYLPNDLPRQIELTPATQVALSQADATLGQLNGLALLISEPEVLMGPFITKEALSSSRIEGTRASLSDVLQAEAIGEDAIRSDDVQEVENYLKANRLAVQLAKELPITQRLIKQVHAELMTGVRGEERMPGEFRRSPVWVGDSAATLETATFVPPIQDHIPELFADWERFVNETTQLPPLVRCALMHYQFETIHPFLDGNGRIGRLLVGLVLTQESRLSVPLLYLSGYLETHRREYYRRLQAVRETGDINGYLQFFLAAVTEQSADAIARASALVGLRESYYRQAEMDRSRVTGLIPIMFRSPFVSTRTVERQLELTNAGARKLLARAESYGWLRNYGAYGRGGMHVWLAPEIYDVVEQAVTYN
jgi:Fic family protein